MRQPRVGSPRPDGCNRRLMHQPHRGRRILQKRLDRQWRANVREHRPPRLLDRRQRDAPPPVHASAPHQRGDRDLGAVRDEGLNRGDAEHHRVADDVVHLLAFDDGRRQRDCHRRFGRGVDPRLQLQANVAANHIGDPRDEFMSAAVKDRDLVADTESQHTRQVLTLLPRQRHELIAEVECRRKKTVHAAL